MNKDRSFESKFNYCCNIMNSLEANNRKKYNFNPPLVGGKMRF